MLHRSRLALRIAGARRSTLVWTVLAVVAALASGSRALVLLADASAAAARYGETVDVAVVTRAIAAGEVIEAGDIGTRALPAALVPRGELSSEPAGLVALSPLAVGEVVLADRVSSSLVPPGWRGLAITPGGASGHPAVVPGDLVEVLDVAGSEPSRIEGVVVDVAEDDGSVTVAVRAEDAPRVAYAASAGTAVLALIAPAPRR